MVGYGWVVGLGGRGGREGVAGVVEKVFTKMKLSVLDQSDDCDSIGGRC